MPSLGDISQLMTAIAALGALYLGWRNSRKLEIVHKATNSMHDEIVGLTRRDGIVEGRALEKSGQ